MKNKYKYYLIRDINEKINLKKQLLFNQRDYYLKKKKLKQSEYILICVKNRTVREEFPGVFRGFYIISLCWECLAYEAESYLTS